MYIRGPHAFCCNGELYEAFIDEKSRVNINVYYVTRSRTSPAGLTFRENFVYMSKGKDLIIQEVGTFIDSNSGTQKPFILVHDAMSQTHYILTVTNIPGDTNTSPKNTLSAIRSLSFKKEELVSMIKVFDGPLIVWTCDKNVNIGFTTKQEQTTFEKKSFPVLDLDKRLANFSVISTVLTNDEIFMFIKYSCKQHQSEEEDLFQGHEGDDIAFEVWSIKPNTDNNTWTQRKLDSSCFLPKQYACTVVDCKVKIKSNNSSNGDEQPKNDVVLLLDGGYIVTLANGCLMNCCHVNTSLTSFQEWNFVGVFDSMTVVIKTSQSKVIVVDTGSGKVTKTWSEVSNIMIGDFLQYGHHQILVTFTEESSDDEGSSWMLTDLAMCEIDSSRWASGMEVDQSDDSCSKGKASALKALSNNLQSSTTNLCSAEQHLSNKVKFLHSTWAHLQRLSGGGETTLPLPEVPLTTLKDDGSLTANMTGKKPLGIKTTVSWQTSVGCHRVIGVDVHNTSNRPLSCCTLSLVQHSTMTETRSMSSQSKWLPHESFEQTDEKRTSETHASKRLRLSPLLTLPITQQKGQPLRPGDRKTLTVSFDGEQAGVQDGWKLWVFLTTLEHGPTGPESGDQVMEGSHRERTICCGSVSMTTKDYLKGTYSIAPDLTSGSVRGPPVVRLASPLWLQKPQKYVFLRAWATGSDVKMTLGVIKVTGQRRKATDWDLRTTTLFLHPGPSQRCPSSCHPDIIQASLSAVQTCTTLLLTSVFTDLTHTAGIIEAQTDFQLAVSLGCLCPVSCPLQYVRITSVCVLSQTKVHLCVWTRDCNQLELLVDYLSSHLPDDVIISHCEDAGLQYAVNDTVSSLSQEVKVLSMMVKTLLEDSSQAVKALMSSSASVAGDMQQDQLTDFQHRFREEQGAVHRCVDTGVPVGDARVLTDNILRLERLTDQHIACMKTVD